jgi:hypothetical protein
VFQTYVIAVDTAQRYGLKVEDVVIVPGRWVLLERSATKLTTAEWAKPSESGSYGEERIGNFSRLLEFDNDEGDYVERKIKTPLNGVPSYLFRHHFMYELSDKTDESKNNKPDENVNYLQWTQTSHPNEVANETVTGLSNTAYSGYMTSTSRLKGLLRTNEFFHKNKIRYSSHESNAWQGTQSSVYGNAALSAFYGPNQMTTDPYLFPRVMELYIWSGPKPDTLPSGQIIGQAIPNSIQ